MARKVMGGMRSLRKSGDTEGKRSQDTVACRNHSMWKQGTASRPGGKLNDTTDAREDGVLLMSGQPGGGVLGSHLRWAQGRDCCDYIW